MRWPELKAMAVQAEELGFDSLWVGDHLIYRQPDSRPSGPWEAWSSLAAIAAVTQSIRLGPLVAATSFHNPAMIAKKASTIDEISGGRLVLGLGAGWNETEYRGFGFPFDHRVSRFEEAFTIIRKLLSREVVNFEGKYYSVEACEILPKPLNPHGPPLLIGSTGPRMLRITLPFVHQWNIWYASFGNTPEGLKPYLERVDNACEAVGRSPDEIDRTAAVLVRTPEGTGRITGAEKDEPRPITGTPGEVAAGLAAFASLGIGELQLVVDPITLESIEWCARALEILDSP